MRNLVVKYNLQISNLDSFTFKTYIDDEKEYREHLNVFKKVIELSKRLDLTYTRIFTFWYEGELDHYLDKLIERLSEAIDIAKTEGIIIVIENEYSCLVGNGRDLKTLLDKVDTRWVKVLWDPGNAFVARETPFPNGYGLIKDHVTHMHVKDVKVINGGFKWMPIGKGSINYRNQLSAVKNKPIVISLETHYRNDKNDPEESTRESFLGMKKILNEIEDSF
ncbi:xylose isomerase, partial [Sulfolobus sp. B5]